MKVADSDGVETVWTSWLRCCMPLASSEKRSRSGRKSSFTTSSTPDRMSPPCNPFLRDIVVLMAEDEKQHHDIIYQQPPYHPQPVAAPQMESPYYPAKSEKAPRGNTEPKRRRFLNISSLYSSRRPVISAPSHFRHITTGSPQFDFPQPEPSPSRNSNLRPARQLPRRSFRPLELSIHLPENRTSPLLPHFGVPDQLPEPEPVYDPFRSEPRTQSDSSPPKTPDQSEKPPPVRELGSPFTPIRGLKRPADSSTPTSTLDRSSEKGTVESKTIEHQRSFSSSMSFHYPRKQLTSTTDSSPFTGQDEDIPPLIPPKSRSRVRALTSSTHTSSTQTSPDVEAIRARVASAMKEVEKLQHQIEDAIERHSLYTNSRPSTAHSVARTMPGETFAVLLGPDARLLTKISDMEPMPSIPALPPAAPSFAERLNSEIVRPHTAPINFRAQTHRRAKTAADAVIGPSTPPPRTGRQKRIESPMQPPLPLILRPPLRKKKSFSRVSSWLFPGAENDRDFGFDSVTNLPRPVTGKDGFYQCVSLGETNGRRPSTDTAGTVSTWESDDDRTFPSTWSPGSTAVTKGEEPLIFRSATFGRNDKIPRRTSVGVAV
ncbi:hypothetical protein BGZ63DRAFT_398241 [Mariannaea sp. PMI_226]|nr:hypothetical protein BGZ63DRAFT_398241 [Mariannaea sp. PMI_226]